MSPLFSISSKIGEIGDTGTIFETRKAFKYSLNKVFSY